MKELIQHIEKLLLSSDCVIIPDFGGFVAHYSPAKWVEEDNLYLPPTRVIGFNSQLKLNDGLLTQDYMDTYGTNFADASRMVTKAVDELKYFLHLNGYLDIHGLGEMTQTINNQYTFKPYNDGIMTPDLYALSSFHINYLHEVREESSRIISHVFTATTDVNNITSDVTEDVEDTDDIKIYSNNRKRVYLFSAITVAAALLIFFLFPVRINNTELSKVNVAQLIPVDAFGGASEVKKHSQQSVAYHTNKIAVKPDSVSDKYFIVVCALSKESKANRLVKSLHKQGNDKSCVIPQKIRYFIAITSYNNRAMAFFGLKKYRADKKYKDAWLLINNNK